MTDTDSHIRQTALQKILTAREEAYNNSALKEACQLPIINFNAKYYYEMIDWSSTSLTSPPVLKFINNEELINKLSSTEVHYDWNFCEYPCHTVAVERAVKLVTEASVKVCDIEGRDGNVAATLASRESFQRFDTKKHFPVEKTI